jgi:hypothetical protein
VSRRPAPPSIGSPEWYEELAAAGADRAVVDEQVRVALLACGTGQVGPDGIFRGFGQ